MNNATAGLIFQLLGAMAIAAFFWTRARQKAVASWPSVQGRVLSSSVETDSDINKYPLIEYQYTVAGKTYESRRIYPHGMAASSGNYAEKLVRKYTPGNTVTVYYDARRPENAVLDKQLPGWVLALQLVAGIIFIIGGSALKP